MISKTIFKRSWSI